MGVDVLKKAAEAKCGLEIENQGLKRSLETSKKTADEYVAKMSAELKNAQRKASEEDVLENEKRGRANTTAAEGSKSGDEMRFEDAVGGDIFRQC